MRLRPGRRPDRGEPLERHDLHKTVRHGHARPTATVPTMDEMFTKAAAAVNDADCVHFKMTNKDGTGGTTTRDVRGALDGSWEQTSCRYPHGVSWTTRIIGHQVFINANKAYWREADLPGLDPARPAGHWVKLTGDVPTGVSSPSLKKLLLANLSDWEPGAMRHEVAEVSTQPAAGTRLYRASCGSEGNELVLDASTWLPTRFTALSETGAMTVTLTEWSDVDPITTPTGYATLQLSAG